jgi:hypothetical protein
MNQYTAARPPKFEPPGQGAGGGTPTEAEVIARIFANAPAHGITILWPGPH